MSTFDLEGLARVVREQSGIELDESKRYLIQTRLEPMCSEFAAASVDELVTRVVRGDNYATTAVVDALTTNETFFFRDSSLWTTLRQTILPELIRNRQGQNELRIWCGACSYGQEPYSLAMMLKEDFPTISHWNIKILATDISRDAIKRAQKAQYSDREVTRGINPQQRERFFRRVGDAWEVKPDLKATVQVLRLNLTASILGVPGPFDLIMIRNVLIYFSPETRVAVLRRAASLLRPEGYLILGSTESVRLGMTELVPRTIGPVNTLRRPGRPSTDAPGVTTTPLSTPTPTTASAVTARPLGAAAPTVHGGTR